MELNSTIQIHTHRQPTIVSLACPYSQDGGRSRKDWFRGGDHQIQLLTSIKLNAAITPLKAGFRKNLVQVEQIATIIGLLGSGDSTSPWLDCWAWSATLSHNG